MENEHVKNELILVFLVSSVIVVIFFLLYFKIIVWLKDEKKHQSRPKTMSQKSAYFTVTREFKISWFSTSDICSSASNSRCCRKYYRSKALGLT